MAMQRSKSWASVGGRPTLRAPSVPKTSGRSVGERSSCSTARSSTATASAVADWNAARPTAIVRAGSRDVARLLGLGEQLAEPLVCCAGVVGEAEVELRLRQPQLAQLVLAHVRAGLEVLGSDAELPRQLARAFTDGCRVPASMREM